MTSAAAPPDAAASPCTNVCRIDADSGWCLGCWRTLDEIARWSTAGPGDRAAILASLPDRRERWSRLHPAARPPGPR